MRSLAWVTLGATALMILSGPSTGQEAPPAPRPEAAPAEDNAAESAADVAEAADILDADALDDLVAPVALYPDPLLSQVLMASTAPLDIVKAERFVASNEAMTDKERAEAARAQPWDPSVQVLAGGFPDIVERMADNIDWTETLGDAMVAQTDDLLDAVQRMRAEAAAAGNLQSNEAQTVTTEDNHIAVAPADPKRVYVPTYDPVAAYVPAVPATTGISAGNVLATGAVAFGTALLLDNIFDDDDDCCWYGRDSIDWGDREIHVDRNVNRDIDRTIHRDINLNGTAWKPSDRERAAARERIAHRTAGRPAGDDLASKVRDVDRARAAERLKERGHVSPGAKNDLKSAARDAKARHDAVGARPDRKPAAKHAKAQTADKHKGGNKAAKVRGAEKVKGKGGQHAAKDISRPKHSSAGKVPPRKADAKKSAFSKPHAASHSHAKKANRGHASARKHR